MSSSTAAERAALDSAAPDLDTLAARHAGRVKPRDLRALHRWLISCPDEPSFEEAVGALENGARWLRSGGALLDLEPAPVVRLRLLVEVLEAVPVWRRTIAAALV